MGDDEEHDNINEREKAATAACVRILEDLLVNDIYIEGINVEFLERIVRPGTPNTLMRALYKLQYDNRAVAKVASSTGRVPRSTKAKSTEQIREQIKSSSNRPITFKNHLVFFVKPEDQQAVKAENYLNYNPFTGTYGPPAKFKFPQQPALSGRYQGAEELPPRGVEQPYRGAEELGTQFGSLSGAGGRSEWGKTELSDGHFPAQGAKGDPWLALLGTAAIAHAPTKEAESAAKHTTRAYKEVVKTKHELERERELRIAAEERASLAQQQARLAAEEQARLVERTSAAQEQARLAEERASRSERTSAALFNRFHQPVQPVAVQNAQSGGPTKKARLERRHSVK
jgi:hypothetical protein